MTIRKRDVQRFMFDLGAMSDEKNAAISNAMQEHDCDHPLSSHTGTDVTFSWRICAHPECGCQILME